MENAEKGRVRHAEIRRAVLHFRQHGGWNAQYVQQFIIPTVFADMIDQCTRGIRGVGYMRLAAGELVDQPAIDGAEADLTFLRTLAQARKHGSATMQVSSRKIGVEQQPGLFRKERFKIAALQFVAKLRRAAILPDNGAVYRLAAYAGPIRRLFRADW